MKLMIKLLVVLSIQHIFGQTYLVNEQDHPRIYGESIKLTFTDSTILATYDSTHVFYGTNPFVFERHGYDTYLYTPNGRLITQHYLGANNTTLFKEQLIIVENESIIIYNVTSDSIRRFNNTGWRLIGMSEDAVYFSSGIFMNYLDGKKIESNSIIKYDGKKMKIVKSRYQGRKIDGRDHFKIHEYECLFYSFHLKIFSSQIVNSQSPVIQICLGKKLVEYSLPISFAYPDIHLINGTFFLYDHASFCWYVLNDQKGLIKSNCTSVFGLTETFEKNGVLFSLSSGYNKVGKQLLNALTRYCIVENNLTPVDLLLLLR